MGGVDLDDVADELYAVPPEHFIARRREYEQQARSHGDRALATAVGALLGWRASGEQWTSVPFRATPGVAVRPDGGVGLAVSLTL